MHMHFYHTQEVNVRWRSWSCCLYGLNVFHASFNAPNTPFATIRCSTVVFIALSYRIERKNAQSKCANPKNTEKDEPYQDALSQ